MTHEATRIIKAPPERLWELLTDTRCWPDWGPSIKCVEIAQPIIAHGSFGHVEIALLPVSMPFVITEYTHLESWSWEVAGRQATTHTLRRLARDHCEVSFGVPSAIFAPYLIICHRALAKIAELA